MLKDIYDFGGGITGVIKGETLILSKTDIKGTGIMSNFNIGKSPIFKVEGIKKVFIEENIKYIGKNTFNYKCFEDVILGKDIEEIGDSAFKECGIKEIKIPNNVKIIGVAAFYSNNITYIRIPDSVKEIGEAAFWLNPINKIDIGDKTQIKTYESLELQEIDTFGNNIGFKLTYENQIYKKGSYNWNKENFKWEKDTSIVSGGGVYSIGFY